MVLESVRYPLDKLSAQFAKLVGSKKPEAAVSIEKVNLNELFTFSHRGQDFSVVSNRVRSLGKEWADKIPGLEKDTVQSLYRFTVTTRSVSSEPLAKIEYYMAITNDGRRLGYELRTDNLKLDKHFEGGTAGSVIEKRKGHISGLTQETIIHLLKSKVVDEWYSSTELTAGGNKLYQSIQARNDVEVDVIDKGKDIRTLRKIQQYKVTLN